ncbi:response regulator transcription factor [Amycolatopsis roodepoortensis]|uniref:response regulator n=1 Tax=Amycolatopsis roodepoortensis TaxID=700274 RepID=UPI00214B345A|nr:response regulator transcription factor [Amycolatopsis roodepoortensis]UUV31696.1 response regulator transcription factor [Amycolatopsis roodepoortensis]
MNRTPPPRLRVLVADDNPVIGDALRALLDSEPDIEVVAVAVDAGEAVALAELLVPEVALLDVRIPGGGGAWMAREIRRRVPHTRLMAFSAHSDTRSIAQMASAGVTEYLVKGSPNTEIVAAIRRVCASGANGTE